MPPPIDYLQTFLYQHVPTELEPPFRQKLGFHEEILALDSLRHRLLRTFPSAGAQVHRLASRRRFFLTLPDLPQLYLPVRVRPLSGDGKNYADLTDLLCSTAGSGRGVLLTARSGAGKSTAMLKAFFDCFIGPDPMLGGRLPCYLRQLHSPRKAFVKARKRKSAGHEVILDLLAEAALLPSVKAKRLEEWLNYSPPLLLFLDLNAADNDLRPVLAEAIVRFQEYFEGKHRFVIAYRSADRDETLNYLKETARFDAYDLRHLEYTDALKYLDNLRGVEDELANELDRNHPRAADRPAAAAPIGAAALQQLFARYGNDPDGLISTPLLMHFVSLIGIERAAKVESLAQLYEEVIEDYLDRDYGDYRREDGKATTPYADVIRHSGLMNAEGRIKIKVAMARVALAIQAAGPKATRLHRRGTLPAETVLDRLLADGKALPEPKWRPPDDWWHKGRYYTESFAEPARRALREFSFLRRDGDAFGFLHDSFLYYFAALAVRCKEEPEIELSVLNVESERAEWCRKAVERMHLSPESWRPPALFLGGMLTPEEVRALLPPLLTAEPTAGWYGVVSQVVSGRRQEAGQDDVVLRELEEGLELVGRFPYSWEAIFSTVYNHLCLGEKLPAACQEYADNILRPAMNLTGRPWLRAESATRFDSKVRCLAFYTTCELIMGHSDGTVRRCPIDDLQHQILYRHEGQVWSVAVDARDGAVLSGGDDGTIRLWRPGDGDANILYRHEGRVWAVAVSTRDGAILSGGMDGTVRRWLPGRDDAEVLYRHGGAVTAVAVDPRDGAVLSASEGGTIRRWLAGQSESTVGSHRERGFVSMAVDARDGSVLWGSNFEVRRWLPGRDDAEDLHDHGPLITSVAVDPWANCVVSSAVRLPLRLFHLGTRRFLDLANPNIDGFSLACSLKHNRIALALADGRLVLVRVEPNVESLLSYPATQKNPPPAASSQ